VSAAPWAQHLLPLIVTIPIAMGALLVAVERQLPRQLADVLELTRSISMNAARN